MSKSGGIVLFLLIASLFVYPIVMAPPVAADLGPIDYTVTRTMLFATNDSDLYFYDVSVQITIMSSMIGYHKYQYYVAIDSHFSLTSLSNDSNKNKTLGFFYPRTWSSSSNFTTNPFNMEISVNESKINYVIVPGRKIKTSTSFTYLMKENDVAVFNVTLPKNGHVSIDVMCTFSSVATTSTYSLSYTIATSKAWYVDPLEQNTIERIKARVYHPKGMSIFFSPLTYGRKLKENPVYTEYLWEIDVKKNTENYVNIMFIQYPFDYSWMDAPTWFIMTLDAMMYFQKHALVYIFLIYFVFFSVILYKRQVGLAKPQSKKYKKRA